MKKEKQNMDQSKEHLLTHDVSNFKSVGKLRNSHISLFKVALRSFERGDFDTANELFSKLASDSFLPTEAHNMVTQNQEDIKVLIQTGAVGVDRSKLDNKFLEKLESRRKEQKKVSKEKNAGDTQTVEQAPKKDIEPSEPPVEMETKGEKVDESNIYPIIKSAMTTFADKLADSLSSVLSGKVEDDIKEHESLSEKMGEVIEEDIEKDIDLSSESLDSFKDMDMEGSINDIYSKEFKSDLYEQTPKSKLDQRDIERFLNVGKQLSQTVSDIKDSLKTLSEEVPEVNKLRDSITETLDNIKNRNKKETLQQLDKDIVDDKEALENLKDREVKPSDIFVDYPTEELEAENIDIPEIQEKKVDKEETEKNLLENLLNKFDSIDSRLKDIETRDEELKEFNEKIKSHFDKEFERYDFSQEANIDDNLKKLEESFEEDDENIKTDLNQIGVGETEEDLLGNLNDRYNKIEDRLRQLALNEEELIDKFDKTFPKADEQKEEIKQEPQKQSLKDKLEGIKEKDYIDDLLHSARTQEPVTEPQSQQEPVTEPINKLSDDELNQLFLDDIEYSDKNYREQNELKQNRQQQQQQQAPRINEPLETLDEEQQETTSEDRQADRQVSEQANESDLYNKLLERRGRFVRSNASDISKKLRSQLDSMGPLEDDGEIDSEELQKDVELREDTYDMQMPPINESDISLPTGEENVYTQMDPYNLEGSLENIVKLKMVGSSEKYINKLMDIENEITDLMSTSEGSEFDDLSAKLKKIKSHEKLEKISKDIEKEMVVNLSVENQKKSEIPKDIDVDDIEGIEETSTQEIELNGKAEAVEAEEAQEGEEGEAETDKIPITTRFYDNQESLGKTLDKLSEVLEKSFERLLGEPKTTEEQEEGEEEEQEETKKKEEPTKKEKQETADDDDGAFIAEDEYIDDEKKVKKQEDTKDKYEYYDDEEEEEKEDDFIADDEVVYKKKEKKKKTLPPKSEEEDNLNIVSSYPDLPPPDSDDSEKEEKEFLTLEDIISDDVYEEEEFTLEDLRREEEKENVHIPGVDMNFMPEPFIPIDEYIHTDGFFTDVDENPILIPDEDEVEDEAEDESFIEDEYSIERTDDLEEQEKKEEELEYQELLKELEERRKSSREAEKKKKPLKLTFDFKDMFHNKSYLKYREILNEAAQLVSEKKLDEALDYYNVILDQDIPKAFKLMIKQNIADITQTIIETFKRSDTIVNVKSSGEVTRLTTKFIEEDKESK